MAVLLLLLFWYIGVSSDVTGDIAMLLSTSPRHSAGLCESELPPTALHKNHLLSRIHQVNT